MKKALAIVKHTLAGALLGVTFFTSERPGPTASDETQAPVNEHTTPTPDACATLAMLLTRWIIFPLDNQGAVYGGSGSNGATEHQIEGRASVIVARQGNRLEVKPRKQQYPVSSSAKKMAVPVANDKGHDCLVWDVTKGIR